MNQAQIWLKENWFRAGLVFLGIILVLGYISYLGGRNALAEQQRLDKLQQEARQNELEQKEYTAERKKDCYATYEGEKKKWSNTRRPEYDSENDACRVVYEAKQGEWEGENCDDYIPAEGLNSSYLTSYLWRQYYLCSAGEFEREF